MISLPEKNYQFATSHEKIDFTKLHDKEISIEDIKCELQLTAIGNWEALDFVIEQQKWNFDQNNLTDYWRPFQPKEGILNDRDSILLYGLKGDIPTSLTGLSHVQKKLGYKPKESEFSFPTEARYKLTCCGEVFDYFDPMGRCFVIRLNPGGFYPRHRDHFLLDRDTFRLIAFLGDSLDTLEWEVEGRIKNFLPNTVYYVDTRKMHRLCSWAHGSTMVVMNVRKTWINVLKLLSRLKHD